MPFAGFTDFDDCKNTMMNDEGYDEESAEKICGALQAENKEDEGNPNELLDKIMNEADAILNELSLDNFSFVENPSQPSKFVALKTEENKIRFENKLVRKQDEDDWSVVYGAVMIPNEVDKDKDVIPASTIRKAAHNFLKDKKNDEIDADHYQITNKGDLVESWLLDEDKSYESIDGEEVEYKSGTWMVGVEPIDEVKEKINNGEYTGFSIMGDAIGADLKSKQKNESKDESKEDVNNSYDFLGDILDEDEFIEQFKDVKQDLNEVKEFMNNLKEEGNMSEDKEDESVEEEPEKDEEPKEEEVKEDEFEDVAELLDYLENELNEENYSMLIDSVRGSEDDKEDDMDDEEKDEEEEKDEGEVEEENKESKSKGYSGEETRKEAIKTKQEKTSKGRKSVMKLIKEE